MVAAASVAPSGRGSRATAIQTAAPPASSVAPRGCKRDERDSGRAHRRDRRGLHRQAAVDEARPHRERERRREHDQRGGDAETAAVPGRERGDR